MQLLANYDNVSETCQYLLDHQGFQGSTRCARASDIAGTPVVLEGLQSRPDLNGKRAVVVQVDEATSRSQVQVEPFVPYLQPRLGVASRFRPGPWQRVVMT